jgi:cytochrome d ubiquinol oxidase subunit I
MQTPQGHALVDGKVVPVDWFKIIFNPSFPYRLVHMSLAAFIVAALLVAACAAWHLLRDRKDPAIRKAFSMALWMLLLVVPIQIAVGDAHGLNTREYQPAKIAAIEGLWDTEKSVALNLVGWPDMKAETTRYALKVPHLGSLVLTHSWDGEVRGLKSFAPEDRPNSTIVFWSFRIMVGMGTLMLILALAGLALRRHGRLYDARWFQRFALYMGPTGLIALLAGWVTTEAGRQPWVVYGVLRTRDAVSAISVQQVGTSLMIFVMVYFLVFGTGIYYMLKLMAKGPNLPHDEAAAEAADTGHGHERFDHRPMSRPTDPIDE